MKVYITFLKRFREPMLNGTATMTTRRNKYGEVGDTFDAFGATFEIIEAGRLALGDIASCWKEEGFSSPEEFQKVWRQIHPRVGYDMEQRFYYHKFKKVSSDGKETF